MSRFLLASLCCLATIQLASAATWWVLDTAPCDAPVNGYAVRVVKCLDHVGAPLTDGMCSAAGPKPATKVTCNQRNLFVQYSTWGECNAACKVNPTANAGTQSRVARCFSQSFTETSYGTPIEQVSGINPNLAPCIASGVVLESLTQSCNDKDCSPFQYYRKALSASCMAPCNNIGVTVKETCVDQNGVEVADARCVAAGVLVDIGGGSLAAYTGGTSVIPCPGDRVCASHLELDARDVKGCSATCGGGFRSRKILCAVWNPAGPGSFTKYFADTDVVKPTSKPTSFSWYDSTGTPTAVPGVCNNFVPSVSDLIVEACNLEPCQAGFEWKCSPWVYDPDSFPEARNNEMRKCTCIDRQTQLPTVSDPVARCGTRPHEAQLTQDPFFLHRTQWSTCTSQCRELGQPVPTHTATYSCMDNLGNAIATNQNYETIVTAHPECSITPLFTGQLWSTIQGVTGACNVEFCQNAAWGIVSSTACTAQCNGGTTTRVVKCINLATGAPFIDDSPCANINPKPLATVACNTAACVPDYVVSPWGKCSKPCVEPQFILADGTIPDSQAGTQTRTVTCVDPSGGGNPCSGPVPSNTRKCNVFSCTNTAFVVKNNNCPKCVYTSPASLANDAQVTKTSCVDPYGVEILPSNAAAFVVCTALYPLVTFGTTAPLSCSGVYGVPLCQAKWVAPQWGPCSQRCSPIVPKGQTPSIGVQTRLDGLIVCMKADGTIGTPADCNGLPKPLSSQSCNLDPCLEDYGYGPPTAPGVYPCLDRDNNVVSPIHCTTLAPPRPPLPQFVAPEPEFSYAFGTTKWTPCTARCNGGTQTRISDCRSRDGTVDPSKCTGPPPVWPVEKCNTQPCPFVLRETDKPGDLCTRSCDGGTVNKLISCVDASVPAATATPIPFSECKVQNPTMLADVSASTPFGDDPLVQSIVRPCNTQPCPGSNLGPAYVQYVKGPWGPCSCPANASSFQTRDVRCVMIAKDNSFPPIPIVTCHRANPTSPITGCDASDVSNHCRDLPVPSPARSCVDPARCADP